MRACRQPSPQVSEILNFNDSSHKSIKSDTNTLQQAAFSQPSMDVFLMTFWYMTEADLTAFRSAIDTFELHHYQSPRKRANAIALSGEKRVALR